MIVKVCGMRQPENIRAVEQAGADWIGLICYDRSPRFVSSVPSYLPQHSKRIGVFVNEDYAGITHRAHELSLDYQQLHGKETPELSKKLHEEGFRLIKAFALRKASDLECTYAYAPYCDYFLFDTRCEGYGGSGKRFDWSILTGYKGETPFLLSGGIRPENAEAIRNFRHPRFAGIDLNSGFEIEPGLKDVDKLKNFIQQILHPAVETGRAPSPTV